MSTQLSQPPTPTQAEPLLTDAGAPLWLRFLHRAEDWFGGFWTAVFDLMLVGLLSLGVLEWHGRTVFTPLLVIGLPLNLRHLLWLWSQVRRGAHPLPLAVALRQPLPRAWLRPVVSLWWLGCFGMGCVFAAMNGQLGKDGERVLLAVLTFGYLYATNGYLLLALSAWTRRRDVLEWVWWLRIVLDLLLATATAWLSGH